MCVFSVEGNLLAEELSNAYLAGTAEKPMNVRKHLVSAHEDVS
jgi:hypothetical protein